MRKIVVLPENYVPSISEEYMNDMQLEYFRQKLVDWKESLADEALQTMQHLKEESWSRTRCSRSSIYSNFNIFRAEN